MKCFNKIIAVALCLSVLFSINSAVALGIMPYADSVFNSATPELLSSKSVTFSAYTYGMKSSISVTACWLEKKDSNGNWGKQCDLPVPTYIATNTFCFSTTVNYSSYIGSGTYRVKATFTADGHSITRTSNEKTF